MDDAEPHARGHAPVFAGGDRTAADAATTRVVAQYARVPTFAMMATVADGPLESNACVRLDREKGEVPDCVDPSLKGDVYACESPPTDNPNILCFQPEEDPGCDPEQISNGAIDGKGWVHRPHRHRVRRRARTYESCSAAVTQTCRDVLGPRSCVYNCVTIMASRRLISR